MLCCVTESNDVISFNLGGVFTERGAFLAKVVQEQLQPSTTHPGGIRLCIFLILFAPKKAAKNMEMKNLNICWRTCCCCKLLQRGSRLHSRGWKQRWPKVWQSNSKKGVPIFQKIHLSVVATSTGRPRYSETRSTMSLSVRAVNTENIRNHIDLDRVLKHL